MAEMPVFVFFKDVRHALRRDELGLEILHIAVPAALALAADPVASLIDTAFVGRLGSVQLAAVGVSIAIFNQASKVAIFPLVNITTSFVAEEETCRRLNEEEQLKDNNGDDLEKAGSSVSQKSNITTTVLVEVDDLEKGSSDAPPIDSKTKAKLKKTKKKNERRQITSASTALAFGGVLGLLQTLILIFLAKPFLSVMHYKKFYHR